MRKRNKKAIIITALVMLAGILLVLAGFFGGSIAGLFFKGFDPKNITSDVIGKNIRTDIMVDYDDLDLENKAVQNFGDREEVYMITLDLSGLSESGFKRKRQAPLLFQNHAAHHDRWYLKTDG